MHIAKLFARHAKALCADIHSAGLSILGLGAIGQSVHTLQTGLEDMPWQVLAGLVGLSAGPAAALLTAAYIMGGMVLEDREMREANTVCRRRVEPPAPR